MYSSFDARLPFPNHIYNRLSNGSVAVECYKNIILFSEIRYFKNGILVIKTCFTEKNVKILVKVKCTAVIYFREVFTICK